MQKKSLINVITLSFSITFVFSIYAATQTQSKINPDFNLKNKMQTLIKLAPNANPKVIKLALNAYEKARSQGYDNKQILTIIDYSIPDTQKRLWTFNLATNKVLYHTLVAQGRNTGLVKATHFSNTSNSKKTSLGLFLTEQPYYGSDGYSLRLKGLSKGFNDQASSRNIVMHGAWYVSEKFVKKYHHLGRSWGCLTLSKKMVKPVINTVENGTLIFAYGKDRNWLEHGPYLTLV